MYASKHAGTEVTISHQSNTEVIITIYHNINFGNYHQPIIISQLIDLPSIKEMMSLVTGTGNAMHTMMQSANLIIRPHS